MAAVFPNTPIGLVAPETLRVFRLLKQLPESFVIWQRLYATEQDGPDFLIRKNDGRTALLKVVIATRTAVRNALQEDLFESTEKPGLAEQRALLDFISTSGIDAQGLPGLLIFPLIPQAELQEALDPPAIGIAWAAKEHATAERFEVWLDKHLGVALSIEQFDSLRRIFSPEVIIPAALTVRSPIIRETRAGLTDYVLSYNQEWVLKHDLDLSDAAETLHDDLSLQLVNGVVGSGKSLILIYRARLLRHFFPHKRVLVLTHNKPLILDLQRRYLQLSKGDSRVEWRTFHGWCQKYWPSSMPRPALIRARQRHTIITQVWQRHLSDSSISPDVLQDEIDWLKDRIITTRAGYLSANRAGRGFALSEGMRERVFSAILEYQAVLQQQQLADYGDVARQIWKAIVEDESQFPHYDIVLIDEAQFFAPIWFEIIKRILAPQRSHLFMVADPTQGFLKRKQSWLASGLNVRGRSQRLEKCYRTTREILSFATQFYQLRLPNDEEVMVALNIQPMPHGIAPALVILPSEQDELSRVTHEIQALVAAGVAYEHILVLHSEWRGTLRTLERLRQTFGDERVATPREQLLSQHIRVCSLDAATGLESPIVFLMGTHRLYEAENSLRLSEEERRERIRDTTRRLYMAMTRAGQRLVITYVGQPPAVLEQALRGSNG